MEEFKLARRSAFRLLSLRNYHSAVLERKLKSKGFSDDVCKQVIAECRRLGFLRDDEAILREFRRGYGPRYIEFKLQLNKSEIRELITRSMQREKIAQMAPKFASKEKAMRTLQRKGFDLELIIEFFS